MQLRKLIKRLQLIDDEYTSEYSQLGGEQTDVVSVVIDGVDVGGDSGASGVTINMADGTKHVMASGRAKKTSQDT